MFTRISCAFVIVILLALAGYTPETVVDAKLSQGGDGPPFDVLSLEVGILSGGRSYPAYFVTPDVEGAQPTVVLLHSINGMEPGYFDLSDRFAAEGFAVLAIEWQTYERIPHDDVKAQLVVDAIAFLDGFPNVDLDRLGLTGFCIGGRDTMLMLPQIEAFKAGVAWYGFPYSGGSVTQPLRPAELIDQLDAPMLIIHGTADRPSAIADIYRYATELDEAGKYFELKVYQGEPHGFILEGGELSQSFAAQDAFEQMVSFFRRTL